MNAKEVIVRELIHRAATVERSSPVFTRAMASMYLDEARRKTYHIKEPLRSELRAEISEAVAALPQACGHRTGTFTCIELAVDGGPCRHHVNG